MVWLNGKVPFSVITVIRLLARVGEVDATLWLKLSTRYFLSHKSKK
jgi:hypothetical protein